MPRNVIKVGKLGKLTPRFTEKRIIDFLLVLIEIFLLAVTAEVL